MLSYSRQASYRQRCKVEERKTNSFLVDSYEKDGMLLGGYDDDQENEIDGIDQSQSNRRLGKRGNMEEDDHTFSSSRHSQLEETKAIVLSVLEETSFTHERAKNLTVEDILILLAAFHRRHIHFTA